MNYLWDMCMYFNLFIRYLWDMCMCIYLFIGVHVRSCGYIDRDIFMNYLHLGAHERWNLRRRIVLCLYCMNMYVCIA